MVGDSHGITPECIVVHGACDELLIVAWNASQRRESSEAPLQVEAKSIIVLPNTFTQYTSRTAEGIWSFRR